MPLVLLSLLIIFVGIVLVLVGRTMNTYEDEEWKGEHWWRETILGPPGYRRAAMIIGGGGMLIVGVVGLLFAILS